MKNINFKSLFLLLILSTGLFVSCQDDAFLAGPDRLFRPIIQSPTAYQTSIQLQWVKYKGAKSYELNLSVDSFKTMLRDDRTDSTTHTFTGLNFDTKYQIRIRAIGDSILANGDTIKSQYFVVQDVTTLDYPTKLITPTSADELDNSIRVKWNQSSAVYTRIDICLHKDSAAIESVNLTTADNLAGVEIIKGLQPLTSYYAYIYQGTAYMGKKLFKTAASQVFTGDVVDLRGYTDAQALTILHQTFVDTLGINHPNGLNLILSGGTTYTIPTLLIPVSMNIVTGLSFGGKAIMAVNGGFAISPSVTVDQVRFENVFFSQGNISGKTKTDGNYGATYLFNLNQAAGNLNKLILEGCDIKYKRGVIRMQTSATIGNISMNNCLCDSIGGYGVINNGNATSRINDIVVSNSTFAHCDKLFVGGQTAGINSITISNITTYCSPATSFYFLDYNTNLVPGGITITNSVFGPGFTGSTVATIALASVNGIRSSAANVTISNCYNTNDLTWAVNAVTLLPVAPITSFTNLGAPSTSIFGNVTTGNYTVTDPRLDKVIGDPRWW
jgi:hypothetical protein